MAAGSVSRTAEVSIVAPRSNASVCRRSGAAPNLVLALVCWIAIAAISCRGADRQDPDADIDVDADLDSDADADTATHSDTDTGTDTEPGTDIDWVTIPQPWYASNELPKPAMEIIETSEPMEAAQTRNPSFRRK